jgi:serine/threonine protein kinase
MNLELLDVLKSKYGVSDLRHLGSGGFGDVYSGTVHEVPRAIKVSREALDAKLLAMADQELAFMQQPAILDCRTIVQLTAVWRELGHLVTVWELGEQSLAARLAECRRKGMSGIPIDELTRYLRNAAAGLDVLNGLGIRHRDIKPDNIILVRGRAKITDLGLALFVGASSLSKTASGTMGYIAPEAYGDEEHNHGRLTATVDIYALAATAIKLATGRDPFGTNPRDIIRNQEAGKPDTTGLTKPQAAAALGALHADPKHRPFNTATEFVAAFFGSAVRSSPMPQPLPNFTSQPTTAMPQDAAFLAPAKAFDFDIVATVESSEAQVRTAVAEARRMETACRYGEADDILD